MANRVVLSPEYFPNPVRSGSISGGFIYVGIVDLDPKIVGNQKQISVLQENGTTIPVAQPIETNAGGVAQYNGSPVTIFVDGAYSLRVDDKYGAQVYYVPDTTGTDSIEPIAQEVVNSFSFDTMALLRAFKNDGDVIYDRITLSGYSSLGDSGGGDYIWDASSILVDDNGGIIQPTGVITGRWILDGEINVNRFGAGSGIVADVEAFAAAYAFSETYRDSETIWINTGSYDFLTTPLLVPSFSSLKGKGSVDIATGNTAISSVIINYSGLTNSAFQMGNGVVSTRGAELLNFALEGNDVGVEGINFNGTIPSPSIGNIISNVNVSGFTDYGIRGQAACWSNALVDVGVHDCGIAQISLETNCNGWTITRPDISTTTESSTADGIIWDGNPALPSFGCTIVGGAIQNTKMGLRPVNGNNITVLGTYFEGNLRAFHASGGGPLTIVGSNMSARNGEDYCAVVANSNVSITGVGTYGNPTVADFHLFKGSGTIHITRGSSTAPIPFDGPVTPLNESWDLYSANGKVSSVYSDRIFEHFTKADARKQIFDAAGDPIITIDPTNVECKNISVGRELTALSDVGISLLFQGVIRATRADTLMELNRITTDGFLIKFKRDLVDVGDISVAGGVVTYGTFNGSHWSSISEDAVLLKGTVLSSVNDLYAKRDYLPNVIISDKVGDSSVYGVYLGDREVYPEEGRRDVLVSGVGAGFIRISKDVVVKKGDYLISKGDGTACVQDDDILRSSTIGKVTSIAIIEVYEDGSYLVPCTLHCG